SIPSGTALAVWTIRRNGARAKLTHVMIPLCAILLAGAAVLAYYNWRITGKAFEFPEVMNIDQYAVMGSMLWENPRPAPEYNNDVMRIFYAYREPLLADVPHSLVEFVEVLWRKAQVVFYFFLGPLLAVPLVIGAGAVIKKRARPLLL